MKTKNKVLIVFLIAAALIIGFFLFRKNEEIADASTVPNLTPVPAPSNEQEVLAVYNKNDDKIVSLANNAILDAYNNRMEFKKLISMLGINYNALLFNDIKYEFTKSLIDRQLGMNLFIVPPSLIAKGLTKRLQEFIQLNNVDDLEERLPATGSSFYPKVIQEILMPLGNFSQELGFSLVPDYTNGELILAGKLGTPSKSDSNNSRFWGLYQADAKVLASNILNILTLQDAELNKWAIQNLLSKGWKINV